MRSPTGAVPVVDLDRAQSVLFGNAICRHIAAKPTGRPLLRTEAIEAAQISEVIEWEETHFSRDVAVFVASEGAEGGDRVRVHLESLKEKLAANSNSSYMFGGSLSLADIVVFPYLFVLFAQSTKGSADLVSAFPSLVEYANRLGQEKSFIQGLKAYNIDSASQLTVVLAEVAAAKGSEKVRYRLSSRPSKRVYITTPIYYVNALPHIGHVYTTIIADALARWFRVRDIPVFFMTGTDEHGQKVAQSAEARGVTPKEFCDDISSRFRHMFDNMNCKYDYFIRTTDADHEQAVAHMWRRLRDAGLIYVGKHEGWYCITDEAFYTESQVCDSVDNNGKPCKRSIETNGICEWKQEENYMFKLSAFEKPVLEWIEKNADSVIPAFRAREVQQFVSGGLHDLSVSRNKSAVKWGIDVPEDPNHVVYVWLDALTNYLTASGFPGKEGQADWCWPADYHIVGKDILKFHAIYWPAFLVGAGIALPKKVVAHGWWTKDKQKISKSLGNVFDPLEVAQRFGLDALRFFLLREASLSSDGDYSETAMIRRLNSDLADSLGNLVLRCISQKLVPDQKVPQPGAYNDVDNALIGLLSDLPGWVDHHFRNAVDIQKALQGIWDVLMELNKYVTDSAPWRLIKSDPARCSTVMYIVIEGVRLVSILVYPAMPESSAKILTALGLQERDFFGDDKLVFGKLVAGQPFGPAPDILFQKHEVPAEEASPKVASVPSGAAAQKPGADKAKKEEQKKIGAPATKAPASAADEPAEVDLLEIRVGKIVEVKRHPDAESLYVEQIDLGEEKPRTIVSGLVKFIPIEQMQDRLVLVLCNLKPAKMRGIESAGMVLAASNQEHTVVELVGVPAGAKVGERVSFAGYPREPDVPHINTKKLDKILAHLSTDAKCVPNYKGAVFTTSAGPCTATLSNATVR
eukprot:ANDGO_03678.mRNA.2 Methionine--tRNA ligase